jgi:hypothetical protein
MIKKISITVAGLLLAFISFVPTASAHVKWFVDTEEVIEKSHNVTPFYYLTSMEVIIWAIISILVVLAFSVLDRLIPEPKKLMAYAEKNKNTIDRVAQAILGLFLITVSLIWKIIIMPEFPVDDAFSGFLQVAQTVIGIMLVINLKPRIASASILGLCAILLYKVGIVAFSENLILVCLAIYFFIRHSPKNSPFAVLDKHAVEIVRVGTGIALIIMAFTEKLSYPELGLSFLDIHHWNFMSNIGLTWFTNNLFVLSTGFAEMIFGIIFILGYLTRINTILIASFFAASVVTMAVQFGMWEVEDLVVYSAAILFVFFGHGQTKFFHLMWPESILHTRTIKTWWR